MNVTLHINDAPVTLENVTRKPQEVAFTLEGTAYVFRKHPLPDGSFVLERETVPGVRQRMSASVWQRAKDAKSVRVAGIEAEVKEFATDAGSITEGSRLSPLAPMPGLVRQILVKANEKVKQGQPLAVMEAMKLQMTLVAGGDAVVEKILVHEGEMIAEGTELVRLKALEAKAAS